MQLAYVLVKSTLGTQNLVSFFAKALERGQTGVSD